MLLVICTATNVLYYLLKLLSIHAKYISFSRLEAQVQACPGSVWTAAHSITVNVTFFRRCLSKFRVFMCHVLRNDIYVRLSFVSVAYHSYMVKECLCAVRLEKRCQTRCYEKRLYSITVRQEGVSKVCWWKLCKKVYCIKIHKVQVYSRKTF